MPLYHVNVPQYDDVLNQSEPKNQTDLNIINYHFQIGVS